MEHLYPKVFIAAAILYHVIHETLLKLARLRVRTYVNTTVEVHVWPKFLLLTFLLGQIEGVDPRHEVFIVDGHVLHAYVAVAVDAQPYVVGELLAKPVNFRVHQVLPGFYLKHLPDIAQVAIGKASFVLEAVAVDLGEHNAHGRVVVPALFSEAAHVLLGYNHVHLTVLWDSHRAYSAVVPGLMAFEGFIEVVIMYTANCHHREVMAEVC